MPPKQLADALTAVNWNKNVEVFLQDSSCVEQIAKANLRLATWAKQFENIDKGNQALCFIREMQSAAHHVAALIGLSLYKSAAGSMRTILETALYYTYFRTHLSELATLVRDSDYFLTKEELLEYHKHHTAEFSTLQQRLGLIGELNAWYSFISSIIHGQIPGAWIEHKSLSDIKHVKPTLDIAVKSFCDVEKIVYKLFLCTVGREYWGSFSTPAKKLLISGLHGDIKLALGLDSA